MHQSAAELLKGDQGIEVGSAKQVFDRRIQIAEGFVNLRGAVNELLYAEILTQTRYQPFGEVDDGV